MTMTSPELDAVVTEVAKIDDELFSEYKGGWNGEIGTALVDAVYSIRARYSAKTPGRGVLGRVKAFRSAHPETANDLTALLEVGPGGIAEYMGHGETRGRLKSECVIDAARALLAMDPPVREADDVQATRLAEIRRTYSSVEGLGWVTARYFLMLLGEPDVKADTMIRRFINGALEAAGHPPVSAKRAYALVTRAHAIDDRGVGLTEYEHAIWLRKGSLVIEADPKA